MHASNNRKETRKNKKYFGFVTSSLMMKVTVAGEKMLLRLSTWMREAVEGTRRAWTVELRNSVLRMLGNRDSLVCDLGS